MSSARSITAAVNPPRAVYLDYPLGRTSGKPGDTANQLSIMHDTLHAFSSITTPGTIIDLPYQWTSDDAWKDGVMRPKKASRDNDRSREHEDDRVERYDTPQYQSDTDAAIADSNCPTCVFLEQP